jgi:hypothetical protein
MGGFQPTEISFLQRGLRREASRPKDVTSAAFAAYPDHVCDDLNIYGTLRFPSAPRYISITDWPFWLDLAAATIQSDIAPTEHAASKCGCRSSRDLAADARIRRLAATNDGKLPVHRRVLAPTAFPSVSPTSTLFPLTH